MDEPLVCAGDAGIGGSIQAVDIDAILAFACRRQVVVRMERDIGDFVIEGTPLVSLLPVGSEESEAEHAAVEQLHDAYTIDSQRTVDQDAAFGIRQIVDVANKALSPGINDTTTAVLCIEHLTALLVRLAQRRMESPYRFAGGVLRVIACSPDFGEFVSAAFDEIRRNGEANMSVLAQLVQAFCTLEGVTEDAARRQALLRQAEALEEVTWRSVRAPLEREQLGQECAALLITLRQATHERRQRVL